MNMRIEYKDKQSEPVRHKITRNERLTPTEWRAAIVAELMNQYKGIGK